MVYLLFLASVLALAQCAARGESREPSASVAELANGESVAEGLGVFALRNDKEYCDFYRLPRDEQVKRITAGIEPYQEPIRRRVLEAYRETFTTDELKALGSFYSSPVGRSIAAKNVALYERLTAIGATYDRAAIAGEYPRPIFLCASGAG